LTVGCRVYQRRNQLQAFDVESFRGALVRQGLSGGVLVSTGDFSREAYRAAADGGTPRIRLIAGAEWMADLAHRKMAIHRRSLSHWFLDERTCQGPGRTNASREQR
jgi:hypothetical protein